MVRRCRLGKRCRWEAILERENNGQRLLCDTKSDLRFRGNKVHPLNETVDVGRVARAQGWWGLIISTAWGWGPIISTVWGVTWLSSRSSDHIFTIEKHLVVFGEWFQGIENGVKCE